MKRTPHLIAAAAGLLILILAAVGFNSYSLYLESRYINVLAPLDLPQTNNGIALQRAALAASDLETVLGSSEITLLQTDYQADQFFKNYPTGFAVLQVAHVGVSSITLAQDLAALGPDLRGRKIVISFSPATFTMGRLPADYYAGNYSRLHGYEMVFSPYLGGAVKAAAARRMLSFPSTFQGDSFFQFALVHAAGVGRINRALYSLSWPLGELQIEAMRLQDHAIVVSYILNHPMDPVVQKTPQSIDWPGVLADALAQQKLDANNNPYGVESDKWWWYARQLTTPIPPGSVDARFIKRVETHPEWSDLQILLEVLKELGAQPLLLSRPMNVHLWEALGVTEGAQNTYYKKLHSLVDPYGFPLVDFQQYGTDIYFSIDQGSHTSREGWIYVDQTLDNFFHGRVQ